MMPRTLHRAALARTALALVAAAALAGCFWQAHGRPADPLVTSFRALRPSVVLFTMQVPSENPKRHGLFDEAYGSGVIIESGDWGSRILTVEHVVHDARVIRLTIDEKKKVPGRVTAGDPGVDLALVETSEPNLAVATLGSSAQLEAGTPIGVAGFPIPDAFDDESLGVATSVRAGRIASVRHDALEVDAPIIPGESGGPIFDPESGVVLGLAESRFDDERAIGFAIPIDDAKRFLAQHPRHS
jgi:S1-C subfamily serine protease